LVTLAVNRGFTGRFWLANCRSICQLFAESHEACNLYDYCYSLIQMKVFMQSHPFVVLGEKVSATCNPMLCLVAWHGKYVWGIF